MKKDKTLDANDTKVPVTDIDEIGIESDSPTQLLNVPQF